MVDAVIQTALEAEYCIQHRNNMHELEKNYSAFVSHLFTLYQRGGQLFEPTFI